VNWRAGQIVQSERRPPVSNLNTYAFSVTRSRRRLRRSVVSRSEVTDDGFKARAVVSAGRAMA